MSAPTRIHPKEGPAGGVSSRDYHLLLSLCDGVLIARALAYMLDSLGRVTRRVNRNHFVNVSRTLEQTPSASDRWPRALHVDARFLVPGWTGSLRPKACPFDLGPTARTGQTGAEKDPVKSLLTLSRTSFPHGRPHVDQCKSTKCGRRPPYYPKTEGLPASPPRGRLRPLPDWCPHGYWLRLLPF